MKSFQKWLTLLVLLAVMFALVPTQEVKADGKILYVNRMYPWESTQDCSSWANACPTLQMALDEAEYGDEIWLRSDTYYPPYSGWALDTSTFHFELKDGVAIYGGFRGTETSRSQRDWVANQTIISGSHAWGVSYHSIIAEDVGPNTIIDGVIINGGNADDNWDDEDGQGGGILIKNASPTLRNVVFTGNQGTAGGAVAVISDDVDKPSQPNFWNVYFIGNGADYGGAIFSQNSIPKIYGAWFSENIAFSNGGAVYFMDSNNVPGTPILAYVNFEDNVALNSGGAIINYNSSPEIFYSVFDSNRSRFGSAMTNDTNSYARVYASTFTGQYNYDVAGSNYQINNLNTSRPVFSRVTVSQNKQPFVSPEFTVTIQNSIIWDNNGHGVTSGTNAVVLTDTILGGGCPSSSTCVNVVNVDPMLGAFDDYEFSWSTVDSRWIDLPTFPLLPGSPAIDAGGQNTTCYDQYSSDNLDQRGVAPIGSTCDMGAFESHGFQIERYGDAANWKQSTEPTEVFPIAVGVRVTSLANEPVNGGYVNFDAPSSGASTNPSSQTMTISNGVASGTVTANSEFGEFVLDVSIPGGSEVVSFYLSNIVDVIYIKPDGTDATNCLSWANACSLQKALSIAVDGMEIWAKAGTYTPGTARSDTFQLTAGVGLYGGFDGTETERTDRDLVANPTFLSGEIGEAGVADNVYHVVTGADGATLDGFTVSDGYADGVGYEGYGAGMYNNGTSPTVENVTFSNNESATYGGGMYNENNTATILSVTFDGNTSQYGGGMFNIDTTLTFNNITFANNAATTGGGGAMANFTATITLINATISGNTAEGWAGGLYLSGGDTTIRNSIFWNNTGGDAINHIYTGGSTAAVYNSVLQWYGTGSGNTTANPMLGTYDYHGGFAKTFALQEGSSAINTADNAYCPEADERGVPRPQPVGGTCDMGAYEYVDTTAPIVSSFTAESPTTFDIEITAFTASDDVGVIGYLITESSAAPLESDAGWSSSAPTTYTVSSDGTYTLYPWAKDATGNVSAVYGSPATVVVETVAPMVDTFTAPDSSDSLEIPITAFTASDGSGTGVTGYLVTAADSAPEPNDSSWSETAPTSFTVEVNGAYTLYPWVKDAAGNVSATYGSPVSVVASEALPTDDFVFIVDGDSFTINVDSSTSYKYNVDCDNDGSLEATAQTGSYTCTYVENEPHTIRIKDNTGYGNGFARIAGGEFCPVEVVQWGTAQWTSMADAFNTCSPVFSATDAPDLSNVTDMSGMFQFSYDFNSPIGDWDTSNVTDMSSMFDQAYTFNQDISDWDTSNVTSMSGMFYAASSFNQDLNDWDTGSVEDMSSMFISTYAFNGNVSAWDTSSVTDMHYMFSDATEFNQNIGSWDTSKVTNMYGMFLGARLFDQDISGWDTSKVTDMSAMFFDALSLKQDLSPWDISSVTTMAGMFENVTLDTADYDGLLNSWSAQAVQTGVTFSGGNSNYCRAESPRNRLTDPTGNNWTITDGGMDCTDAPLFWSDEFGYGEGWENPETPRTVADVNGDGVNDLIGFSPAGVRIALGTGIGFEESVQWLNAFGSNPEAGNWGGDNTIRTAADVNGDGMADIVGFGDFGVMVSLSTGTSFEAPEYWIYGYGSNPAMGGWSSTENNRVVADVNGDGMADVVGYADYGVLVSLSTGSSFQTAEYWVMGYGRLLGGWDGIQNPRMIADINGDGCGDVVGFGNFGVVASISNACETTPSNSFGDAAYWTYGYGYMLGAWDATQHIRTFGDVDGDGAADLIGFGDYGVLVSLSDGTSSFGDADYWKMGYGYVSGGWDVNYNPRMIADINGDGLGDVVGYATDGVLVELSDGTKFE